MFGYPVSVNRYWRNFKGRTVLSAEAIKYKRHVGSQYATWGGKYHHTESVCVHFMLHPKLTKAGTASKTRIDLDNCIKVVLDALNNAAYRDDKQVVKLVAEIAEPIQGGGVSISVEAV